MPTGSPQSPPRRHVVLVAPEIHWNTGNIGRTCLAAGACLHLIRPLGFSLQSREVRRAGLDYWEKVQLRVWENFEDFQQSMQPHPAEVALFAKTGGKCFWEMSRGRRMFLVFGSETRGLPEDVRKRYPQSTYHIPITAEIRSLNLSTAVGIVLYESLRGYPSFHAYS